MNKKNNNDHAYQQQTLAVRSGQKRTQEQEHSEALFLTSSYVFNNAAEAAARFSGESKGNIYSRFTNPTTRTFEERLASLEGGERCIASSSGMSAIFSICLAFLKQGDHIVSSRSIFGATVALFEQYLEKFGVEVTFVDLIDFDAWQQSIKSNTKLFFLETPTNPLGEIVDIQKVAAIAHSRDVLLVVDNCFCTPALQQPLALGADIVMHSATKFIDGQGRCVGGAVVGSEEDMEKIYGVIRTTGSCISPFNAWVMLKGLETLSLRMKAHCENALEMARWLEEQSCVEKVFYSGLASHPDYQLAKKQQSGCGGVLSFSVKGDKAAAWQVIDSVKVMSITTNLGDSKTTISHPASTSHGRLSDEQKEKVGITDSLIRLSVGLESVDDLKQDLLSAFKKISD